MIKKREIELLLNDGKYYAFSERAKEDSDVSAMESYLRKYNIRIIQESVVDKEERLALIMSEMRRQYSRQEVTHFNTSNTFVLQYFLYNSFKIKNENIIFSEFVKMIPEDKLFEYVETIMKLETSTVVSEDDEKKKHLPFLRKLAALFS
jgi:hypothetical protein